MTRAEEVLLDQALPLPWHVHQTALATHIMAGTIVVATVARYNDAVLLVEAVKWFADRTQDQCAEIRELKREIRDLKNEIDNPVKVEV